MNLTELVREFQTGKISPPEYISQIESYYSSREPDVLSFIPESNRFDRLTKEAGDLVAAYPDPNQRPLLFGVLLGVKDIFHVDGFTTQAGSQLPADDLKGSQAESVTRLKTAGALILGKTVTTEFAYFTPGPTRNPHNTDHTPGGSSSGSAAAIGAGFCHLTLGTQTIGSVIRPAAFCGTIGFKPTYERISREGVIPLSPSLDHVGLFTSNIELAQKAARVLIDDWQDVTKRTKPKLGIPDGLYLNSASDYAQACFEELTRSLAEAGYNLHHVNMMEDFQEIRNRHDAILSYDAAQVHKEWFARHEELYSQKFTDLIKRGQKVTDVLLRDAYKGRDEFHSSVTKTMQDLNIDLWICPPAVGPAPKGLDATGDPVMDLPWTQIGFPALNIPTTKNEVGLPMGLQVVGKPNEDESLFSWAGELEEIVRMI